MTAPRIPRRVSSPERNLGLVLLGCIVFWTTLIGLVWWTAH